MSALLRALGAFGLACLVAKATFAAQDVKFAELVEPSELPSATTNSSFSDNIKLVSNNEESASSSACGESCDDSNNCSMSKMCCCCEPTWSVTAGAVFLNRSRPAQGAILTTIGGGGGVISNGGDFGFGWDAGPDVTISKRMANGLIWEVRYFNDRDADATANYPGVSGAHVFGVNVLGITSLTANYFTNLDSTEINLRRPVNDVCSFLVGFRWIELHDQLSYSYNNGVLTTTFNDDNHLYGGQIGMNLDLLHGDTPWRINAAFKAGVYGNAADNDFRANGIFATTSANASSVAFAGDINVSVSYQLTNHWSIRGGYQLLWLDQLALASDNAVHAAAAGLGGIDTSGTLFYNGATAAVELDW